MLFKGLYHYCLSCSIQEYSVVLRRIRIQDCFVIPYNPTILKAIQNRIDITPIYSVNEWWKLEEKHSEGLENLDNIEEISNLLSTHTLVPLSEVYALADPQKIKDVNSAPIEYLGIYEETKPKFRKIKVSNETSFEYPGMGHFQELSSNINRHFNRINAESLLLVETALWYDKISQEQAKEIYHIYKDKISSIPTGDILGIYGEKFPTYILCKNMHILKLRKNRKVLQIPDFTNLSKEEKLCKIMLYFPIKPGQKIDTERLGTHLLSIIYYSLFLPLR